MWMTKEAAVRLLFYRVIRLPIAEDEINVASYVAILEEMATSPVVQRILAPDERAVVKLCLVASIINATACRPTAPPRGTGAEFWSAHQIKGR